MRKLYLRKLYKKNLRIVYQYVYISFKHRVFICILVVFLLVTLAVYSLPNSSSGGSTGGTPTPTQPIRQPTPTAPAPITPAPGNKLPGGWSSFLLGKGGFNSSESAITAATAPSLARSWTVHAGGGISSEPIVVDGTVYWGSWDGYEHATSIGGQERWATYLGSISNYRCYPTRVGVASTATLMPVTFNEMTRLVDFVGGGNAHFYALDAATGKILWSTSLGSAPGTFIWDSPVIYQGHIYIGTASAGECPATQGRFFQLSVTTGAIEHVLDLVPQGCLGGGVWGSPTIDTQTGELYITTSNADICDVDEPYAMSALELHAATLTIVGSWRVPDTEAADNGDFGVTPTLFTARLGGIARGLVGAVNKNGIFYAFRRGDIGAGPIWQDQISVPLNGCGKCPSGDEAAAAWDGAHLYAGSTSTTIGGKFCYGSVRALDPATGSFLWQRCLSVAYRVMAPLILVPGLVVTGAGPTFFVLDAATGKTLFEYSDLSNNSTFDGAATIADGVLYIGNLDGTLFAFTLQGAKGH